MCSNLLKYPEYLLLCNHKYRGIRFRVQGVQAGKSAECWQNSPFHPKIKTGQA